MELTSLFLSLIAQLHLSSIEVIGGSREFPVQGAAQGVPHGKE